VAHNIKYDYKVLIRHGFKVNGVLEDTLIIAQMNGELKSENRKLKTLVRELFDENYKTFDDLMSQYHPNLKKAKWNVDTIPVKELGAYCANDCKITYKLFEKLVEITDPTNLKVYNEIEKPLLKMVLDMELKGVPLNSAACEKGYNDCLTKMDFCKGWLFDWCGKEFNLNPSLELEEVLFDRMKLPIFKLNDNGRPRLDDTTLKRLAKMGYQEAIWLLRYREQAKLASTYYRKYLKCQTNGKIHANFQQTGTDTGRFSSSDPNLQNVHPEALHVFTASPGNILLSFDYKQMELVMLANLSKDRVMSEAALAGRDLHDETAKQLGVDRATAKVFNFGIPYRMSAWGIAKNLKAVGQWRSLEECNQLLEKHMEEFRGIEEYAQRQIAFGREHGYIETIIGRKRWIEQDEETSAQHFESQCVNTPIQGSCADIIKMAMVNIAKYRYVPIVQVHDELIFDVPLAEKEAVIKIVKKEMEEAIKLPVPMRVEVSEGNSWAEL
jgi:DNA polymerase-1